jgi:ElaB/YqjD/DUF883 family membrane-anchored ribosome-binding protein
MSDFTSSTPPTTGGGTPVGGTSGTTSTSSGSSGTQSTKEAVGTAGSQVAGEAKDRAGEVAREAGQRARNLLDEARSGVTSQASTQQQRLAQGLRGLGSELGQMGRSTEDPGYASDFAQRGSDAVDRLADWFEQREPGDILREVQEFARRRPGAFLGIAAGAGLVVGRLLRGARDSSEGGGGESRYQGAQYGTTGSTYGTDTAYATTGTTGATYGTTGSSYGTTDSPYGTTGTASGTSSTGGVGNVSGS